MGWLVDGGPHVMLLKIPAENVNLSRKCKKLCSESNGECSGLTKRSQDYFEPKTESESESESDLLTFTTHTGIQTKQLQKQVHTKRNQTN